MWLPHAGFASASPLEACLAHATSMAAHREIFASQAQVDRCPQSHRRGRADGREPGSIPQRRSLRLSDIDANRLAVSGVVHKQFRTGLFDMVAIVARRAGKVEVGRQWTPSAKVTSRYDDFVDTPFWQILFFWPHRSNRLRHHELQRPSVRCSPDRMGRLAPRPLPLIPRRCQAD